MDKTQYVSSEKPACWDKIISEWGEEMEDRWHNGLVITYAGVIHCRSGHIDAQTYAHEIVHVRQQQDIDPEEYVSRFFSDRDFRFRMELEAFKAEADWVNQNVKDRNLRIKKLIRMRSNFARNYNLMITYQEAQNLIK